MEAGVFGNKRIIAIIPARGGSKRIHKKNIIPIAGKPMIHWTIQAAKKCQYIDKILVSTDCSEIQSISNQAGAEAPFLRIEKADDHTPVSQASLFALHQAEKLWGSFDIVIQLMPNCPLRGADIILESVNQFFSDSRSSQISYYKYGWMNPWWAHTISNNNEPIPLFKDSIQSRSQDLKDLYCPTGSIWISKAANLKEHETFYSPGFKAHIIDWVSALDIDEEADFQMAEAVFSLRHKNT